MIGFGQPLHVSDVKHREGANKASNDLAVGQSGEVLFFLLLATKLYVSGTG